MGISDDRRMAELRYRRQRNKHLVMAVGYITSVIPAILIAINFETCRQYALSALGGKDATVQAGVVPQPTVAAAEPAAPVPSRRQPRTTPPPPTTLALNVQQRQIAEPKFFEDGVEIPAKPRQPQQLLSNRRPAEPVERVKPDYVIKFDLGRPRQYVQIQPLKDGEKIRLEEADAQQHIPIDYAGLFLVKDADTELVFDDTFRPRATLSIETRTSGDVIVLVYEVNSVSGKVLPFTTSNLNRIRRKTLDRGQNAQGQLSAMETELAHKTRWLQTWSGKLWTEKRAAERRIAELPQLIAAQKVIVASIQSDLASLDNLIELSNSVHGSSLNAYVQR